MSKIKFEIGQRVEIVETGERATVTSDQKRGIVMVYPDDFVPFDDGSHSVEMFVQELRELPAQQDSDIYIFRFEGTDINGDIVSVNQPSTCQYSARKAILNCYGHICDNWYYVGRV